MGSDRGGRERVRQDDDVSRPILGAFSEPRLRNKEKSEGEVRGAPDIARILCGNFTPKRYTGNCERWTCPRSVYVAAKAGVEPMILRTQGVDSTNVPHTPLIISTQPLFLAVPVP